ncbi:cytochrome c oxidase subunit 2 [Meinhardsimonia xiamenensis]|jgi:cytochrome c oxidase subunit 2|uniref:Cytochrome c oxidase subunit 2 n=1 Tax=Meinhardsimonia xiamenensis TaxID=990712 RepID=A0A1G9DC34_9RHOB|nr:cytochrome C oxidase subunit II [Meinhardsimonia xiamenensis]PRX38050.1 cytochrome c oxidase subunit 2 [Meinhardsimonia xiamenensis]SDK61405.1 cytochrome c oxidase subunit 2 [Meinhardsimonia xiamenensis]
MAITPPANRLWWKEPIHGVELGWIVIAFLWGLFMFFFMIAWHFIGDQNLSTETYRVKPAAYEEKVAAWAEQYQKIGADGEPVEVEGTPVVAPPEGGDVYILARLWEFWPVVELKKGVKYRIHISSVDWQHGFSLQPVNMNISVHPGYEHVINLTPTETGEFGIVCNEYCGIGHHTMTGLIRVVE